MGPTVDLTPSPRPTTGGLRVLPRWGYCRQFMRDINEENLETDVVLGRDKVVKLRDLVPYDEWPGALD